MEAWKKKVIKPMVDESAYKGKAKSAIDYA